MTRPARVDTHMRLLLLALLTLPLAAEHHQLDSTPKTVHWGFYSAAHPPVLRVQSGDTVTLRSAMIDTPEALEQIGVPGREIEASHRSIHSQVKNEGPGPHILTGPIYVEGAEPGDTLEVRIQSVGTLAFFR